MTGAKKHDKAVARFDFTYRCCSERVLARFRIPVCLKLGIRRGEDFVFSPTLSNFFVPHNQENKVNKALKRALVVRFALYTF